MSNKPNLKRLKPAGHNKDVLVNYCIMKRSEQPADVKGALQCVVEHVINNPVYYNVEPTMFEGEILFSIIGFPRDQARFIQDVEGKLRACNCIMRNSKYLPVPVKEASAMPKI